MTTQRASRAIRGIVALLAVAAFALSACGNSDTAGKAGSTTTSVASSSVASTAVPGVTADQIRFGAIGTGNANPMGECVITCFTDGVKAYFAYRNSTGGVDGRKLVLTKTLDDQLAQNKARSLDVVSANDVFGVFDAPLLADGYADLDKAGIPTYTWAINFAEMSGLKSIFGNTGVICVACVERSPVYVATLAKAKKIAVVGYNAAQVSTDCVKGQVAAIKRFGDVTGQKVVYSNDSLPFGLPNGIGPEVTAMKDAGAQLVISCWELNASKTLEQEMQRQGMGDVPQMSSNLYNTDFVAQNAALFEGDIVRVPFRPFESSPVGASATYKKWMAATGARLSEVSMYGWINADLAYQGLKAAGPGFDRQKVIDATNKMTHYSADGLVNPIDWSRQHIAPTDADPVTHGYAKECYSFLRVKNGKLDLIGDPNKPFACWPVTDPLKWSEPVATDVGS
jgi:ABC-type branched-subunit amino acid transport system substrate-binding protein